MPKVTMFFKPSIVELELNFIPFAGFASDVREWVAALASTNEVELGIDDVDFIPQPYPPGTLTADPIAFEIETIGFDSRKKKITSEALFTLKGKLIDGLSRVPGCPPIKVERPLIWLKYVDPDGHHI